LIKVFYSEGFIFKKKLINFRWSERTLRQNKLKTVYRRSCRFERKNGC